MTVLRAQTELEVPILTLYSPSTLFYAYWFLHILRGFLGIWSQSGSTLDSESFLVIHDGNKGFIVQNQVIMVLFSFFVQLLSCWEWFLMFRAGFQRWKSAFNVQITTEI